MDLQDRAKEIAAKANECCERSDGYEEAVESVALRHLTEAVERLTAENERLRGRNAALVESLRAHRCLVDNRATVGECQQCGCIDGLLISGDTQQQAVNSEEGK